MASGREAMLGRIRAALGHPGGSAAVPEPPTPLPPRLEGVMPPITPEELLPKFESELKKVAAVSHRVSSTTELEATIGEILKASQASAVVLSRNPLLTELGLAEKLRAWGTTVNAWSVGSEEGRRAVEATQQAGFGLPDFKRVSFAATVGITGVDFALAETGTLVLTSRTEGSQLASLAPPVHVAIYRRNQLVASLEEVLEALPGSGHSKIPSPGRSVVFITGTSRTADIEQILIRGVHGPRDVHAILVEGSCLP